MKLVASVILSVRAFQPALFVTPQIGCSLSQPTSRGVHTSTLHGYMTSRPIHTSCLPYRAGFKDVMSPKLLVTTNLSGT